ncbi:PRC-barrel domain-containing protein [Streptomyces sp. NPDC051993]|uniref:PRC-barrel domain-containing protein n=1 Tax=unclassified Streptomyces TaxID=2593676 RepID=UPI00341C3964
MSMLMLASSLCGRPVVTLSGEVVAQVKDTVFDAPGGQITGFTLAGRGLLGGPLKQSLPWPRVHCLGPDAVMIASAEALEDKAAVVAGDEAQSGNVRGARVLTDGGLAVGTVLDVVVEGGVSGTVAGFEIAFAKELGAEGRKAFLPVGTSLAMTGDTLIVPAQAAGRAVDGLDALAAHLTAGQESHGAVSTRKGRARHDAAQRGLGPLGNQRC